MSFQTTGKRTEEGAAFANGLGLSHATLVLAKADELIESVLLGVRHCDELQGYFEALASYS